jgi:hypothetical protein
VEGMPEIVKGALDHRLFTQRTETLGARPTRGDELRPARCRDARDLNRWRRRRCAWQPFG